MICDAWENFDSAVFKKSSHTTQSSSTEMASSSPFLRFHTMEIQVSQLRWYGGHRGPWDPETVKYSIANLSSQNTFIQSHFKSQLSLDFGDDSLQQPNSLWIVLFCIRRAFNPCCIIQLQKKTKKTKKPAAWLIVSVGFSVYCLFIHWVDYELQWLCERSSVFCLLQQPHL